MKNKVLIELIVPEVDEKFNIYIPVNKKIGNIIVLLSKSIKELTNGYYDGNNHVALYNQLTGEKYSINSLVRETDIRNATKLIFM